MKKLFIYSLVVCLSAFLFSQEVAEDEFMDTEPIEFTHFSGEYTHVDTLEEIQGIGRTLGSNIDIFKNGSARFGHFSILHSYQPEIPKGLDGDILILSDTSGVDHVRNLRHIIAGFLEETYGYSYNRAYLLAEFITYYNAVYYQKIDHFQDRYKAGVLAALTPDRCGLSRIYSDWPGRARIVIPLRNPNQEGISSIDTSIISDDQVIQQMQEEEDQNLQERKDMVELREEENQQEKEILQQQEDQLNQQKNDLQNDNKQITEELENLQNKDNLTQQEEDRKTELEKQQQDVEKQLEEVDQQVNDNQNDQKELEKRNDEVLDMRDNIAKDENKQIQEGTDGKEPQDKETLFTNGEEQGPVPMHFFHYLGQEDGVPYGNIYLYDLTSSTKTSESTITTLYGRGYTQYNSLFLSVGKNRNTGESHLMLIDKENLGLLKESSRIIHPGSKLVIDNSNQIYAACESDGKWYVGRFDKDLNLKVISNQAVNPFTDILFYNGRIFVQDEAGNLVELNYQSLVAEKEYR